MRARRLGITALVLAAGSTAVATAAGSAAPRDARAVTAANDPDVQAVFTQTLVDDPGTSATIRTLLQTGAAFVDPRSGFVDVTGDGRQDALVVVTTGGAAGAVGLSVLSTHGQKGSDTALKAIFRLGALHDATLRVGRTSLTVLEPVFRRGDDLCCPARLRSRTYTFDADAVAFHRVDDRTVPYG